MLLSIRHRVACDNPFNKQLQSLCTTLLKNLFMDIKDTVLALKELTAWGRGEEMEKFRKCINNAVWYVL